MVLTGHHVQLLWSGWLLSIIAFSHVKLLIPPLKPIVYAFVVVVSFHARLTIFHVIEEGKREEKNSF